MRLTINTDEGFWAFEDMDVVHVELLQCVEDDSDTAGEAKARRRLFPNPLDSDPKGDHAEFIADWQEFVGEDLEHKFSSEVGMVLADLETVQSYEVEDEVLYRLLVPMDHGWSWYSAFNQARLALDAIYEFHAEGKNPEDEEVPDDDADDEVHQRYGAYVRFDFYGVIQEWMVRHVLD